MKRWVEINKSDTILQHYFTLKSELYKTQCLLSSIL